ncbi:MAG: carbon-nitrogen hydrolase family protein [Thermoplasmataceae archaeon]
MREISITGFQLPVVTKEEADGLLKSTIKKIREENLSIAVFPERWVSDIIDVNTSTYNEILGPILDISKEMEIAIVPGSFLSKNDDKVTNASPFIDKGKIVGWQEKISPFMMEKQKITGGKQIQLFQYLDLSVGIAICYDIDFPYYSRILASRGCDLILNPALIVENFHDMWHLYVKARALENRVGIVSINSSSDFFMGESIAALPSPFRFGAKLSTVISSQTSEVRAKFDYESLRELRKKRLEDDPGIYEFRTPQ